MVNVLLFTCKSLVCDSIRIRQIDKEMDMFLNVLIGNNDAKQKDDIIHILMYNRLYWISS